MKRLTQFLVNRSEEQDFLYLRKNNYFYIDKTDFIRQWWESADDMGHGGNSQGHGLINIGKYLI